VSVTNEPQPEGWGLRQKEYLQSNVKQRETVHGRPNLPAVADRKSPPVPVEERDVRAQGDAEAIGSLQWLALTARPDIAAITAMCASLQTRSPEQAGTSAATTWRYLKATREKAIYMLPRGHAE